jgi:GT2 family glycosyltransferase
MPEPSFKTFLINSNHDFKKAYLYKKAYNTILKQNLFDRNFYINNYFQKEELCMDPLIHYLFFGYKQHKVPNLNFDGDIYLNNYPEVKKLDINPLVHYVLFGKKEGKNIFLSSQFNNHDKIININKLFLNNYVFDFEPLVSIIVLNRNGLVHLERLFDNFSFLANYNNFEVVVVDNASVDGSVDFLKSLSVDFSIKIIENDVNKSFSEANNQAVDFCDGDYVLLLNNDMEPTFGWLNEMMGVMLNNDNVGAVGAKLVYPYYYDEKNNFKSYLIQHVGDIFGQRIEPCCAYAYNKNKFENVYESTINKTNSSIAVTAAAVLIKKSIYKELNGLNEEYFYGFEDVDLMLNLHKKGYKTLYCSTALLFHHESSTRIINEKEYLTNDKNNTKILWKTQGKYITKNIFLDKLNNQKFFTEQPLKFIFLMEDFSINNVNYKFISNLAKKLIKKDFNVELLTLSEKQDTGDDGDIIISFSANYNIEDLRVRKNSLKILLLNENITNQNFNNFEIIITQDENIYKIIQQEYKNSYFIKSDKDFDVELLLILKNYIINNL